MARRTRRGLSGTPKQHKAKGDSAQSKALKSFGSAIKKATSHACRGAFKALESGIGHLAVSNENYRWGGGALVSIRRVHDRAVKTFTANCVLKPAKKIRGRGNVIRGTF